MRHAGTLKLRDWRSFSAPFFKLMAMVEDATEEEAERLMLKALPVEWRRKVEIEVSKRNREGLMVVEGLPINMDESMVHQFIMVETGEAPKKVRVLAPGKWKVQAANEDHRKEIMKMDRQRLDNGARISVRLVEDRLTVKDIDTQMRRWLQVDDRVNQATRGERGEDRRDDRGRRDDRHRFTREVVVEDAESDAGLVAAIGEFSNGKPRPRSMEAHPKKGTTEKQTEEKGREKNTETKVPMAPSTTPPATPPQGQRVAAPQWTPDAQWWHGNQWPGQTCWTPQWQPWNSGKGGYDRGYGGGARRDWGRKGDKGGGD